MKEKLLNIELEIRKLPKSIKDFCLKLVEEFYVIKEKLKDLAKTNYELGLFHLDKGNINDAKIRFIIVIKLRPEFALAHYHLARCYILNISFTKAKNELETALSLDPTLKEAQYRLDLINNSLNDVVIPIQVVKEDYNNLSNDYESFITEESKYTAPELLSSLIAEHSSYLKNQDVFVLDLGCGTGLVGNYLVRSVAIKSLTGVDVSSNMLEQAESLHLKGHKIYTELKELDFSDLQHIKDKFNIITSCMSMGYLNDLDKFFKELNNISVEGTILGIVVLKSNDYKPSFNVDYGSFSFSEDYLRDVFKKFGWSIKDTKEIRLFLNGTKGLMFVLKK